MFHRYGCCIYANAVVGKGFFIVHPVGIVIGKCIIGNDFRIYQNTTVGVKNPGDEAKGLTPVVGNIVSLCSNSCILGAVHIADGVTIGANSLVIKDIGEAGTYVGSPVRKII